MGTGQDLTGAHWRKSSYSGSSGGDCIECAPLDGTTWRKSSYSGTNGGDCIECAPLNGTTWHKSSYSGNTGGECIECAQAPCNGDIAIRDSKNPGGLTFTVKAAAFGHFVAATVSGDLRRSSPR
ncbi:MULTISPECIES: DUF397 domain-containing protein [unclassified Streptomyces]|uniref:DUF397 domain-containing protein n=1 Tax=unclassified Streptomyces TaxID=2593676 RepID=UPI0033D36230